MNVKEQLLEAVGRSERTTFEVSRSEQTREKRAYHLSAARNELKLYAHNVDFMENINVIQLSQ